MNHKTVAGCGFILFELFGLSLCSGCTSLPQPKFKAYKFPEQAFVQEVKRPYTVIGTVRAKVEFTTLDPNRDEDALCKNYFNKAVLDLLKSAHEKGADAVVEVRSVVFLENGAREMYPTPECSDDGAEGQILAQGLAVKWEQEAKKPQSDSVAP